MSLSTNNYKKLGLSFVPSAFDGAGIDTKPHPNSRIRDYKFDVINLGTLRNVIPTAVLRKTLYNDILFSRRKQNAFENIIIKNDNKIYETISELALNFYGDYSYFAPYKIRFETLNSNFFKPLLESRETHLKSIDRNLPFSRIQFPANLSNNTSLTGAKLNYQPITIQNNVITSGYYITGYNSGINYDNRNTFLYKKYENVSGYLPYPNSVTLWQYPVFQLNTVIALDSVYTYPEMYKDMNGLLVASLKSTNGTEKIVYVSPHGVQNRFVNTIVDNLELRLSKIQPKVAGKPPKYEYVQINSGISVNILDIGSEYLPSGQNIFDSGISLNPIIDNFNSGINNKYKLLNVLKQTTPLKDTWFYKFYSGLYINNKTLATGTWDGTIPSGHSITLEYITTKDGRMGTNNEFRFFYKNYGDNSYIDQTIRNTFKNPLTTGSGNFIISEPVLKRGFGLSYNLRKSIELSNNNLRKGINNSYLQLRKNLPSGIKIFPDNSKTRRFRNLYTTNIYDYETVESIPSGVYGCFKLANKQVICIDPPRNQ
jgi:hypothetical protein